MKTSILSLATFVAAILLMAGTQGCYTQMGTTREEQGYSEQRQQQEAPAEADEDSSAEGDYATPPEDAGQDWNAEVHVGMDGYYPSTWWPSVGFSLAYNDPWYGYGYPYYGYGSGYPYYGYGYPYYPYDPYYGYGSGYCGYYPVTAVPWQNREFGSTRTGGNTRNSHGVNASNGSRGGITEPLQQMDLQGGTDRIVPGGTAAGKRTSGASATTAKPSRSNGTSRKAVSRKMDQKLSPGQKGSKSDRDLRRLYRDRGSVSGSGRSRNTESGPSLNSTAPSSGGASARQGSTTRPSGSSQPSRGSGSTVRSAPAPSVAPAQAPRSGGPAPSSGGSRSGGGGGGGGRRR